MSRTGDWNIEQIKSYMRSVLGESKEKNDDIEGSKCCFKDCNNHIGRWGHNAEPCIKNGKCCEHCNIAEVIPARITRMAYKGEGGKKM